MELIPRRATQKAPSERFTGDVWFEELIAAPEPSRLRMSVVHFAPGARTAWHSHSLGQTLYVTYGSGLVQARGGEVRALVAGDVVHTPAGEWHWHGAAPGHYMTHIAVSEEDLSSEEPKTSWGAHVSEDECLS